MRYLSKSIEKSQELKSQSQENHHVRSTALSERLISLLVSVKKSL